MDEESIVEVGDGGDRGWSDYDEEDFIDCRPTRETESRHRHLFDLEDQRRSKREYKKGLLLAAGCTPSLVAEEESKQQDFIGMSGMM